MNLLVKIKNGSLIPLPRTYTHDGISYSNYDLLPEDVLLSHGWKPLITEPPPEAQEGIGYTATYTDSGDSILCEWEPYELPEPKPYIDPIDAVWEALACAIAEGVNSIDA